SVASVVMLTMVHIRETVQALAYLFCFCLAALLYFQPRRILLRGGLLLVLTVGVMLAYGLYHRQLVGHVTDLDNEIKQKAIDELRQTPLPELLLGTGFVKQESSLYYGWSPLLVLLSPLALLAFSRRPMVLLMGGSIFGYLLVFRVPLL